MSSYLFIRNKIPVCWTTAFSCLDNGFLLLSQQLLLHWSEVPLFGCCYNTCGPVVTTSTTGLRWFLELLYSRIGIFRGWMVLGKWFNLKQWRQEQARWKCGAEQFSLGLIEPSSNGITFMFGVQKPTNFSHHQSNKELKQWWSWQRLSSFGFTE